MRPRRARSQMRVVPLLLAVLVFQGCAAFAYTNIRLATPASGPSMNAAPQASFKIVRRPTKTKDRVLVLLALSGGGSRAAYFSARTMLALTRIPGPQGTPIDVLNEVDLISSVSGGSLAAAYYASTFDPGDSRAPAGRRIWAERTIGELMRRDYILRWLGNWLWPANIARFWFTSFDRTDIMAQTFADNLFDHTTTGVDLLMRDLNPARPNLVLNATIGSRSYDTKTFGTVFTFTREDFVTKLNSDISSYELARAVMASAAFPAAFNYMTLGDLREQPRCPDDGPCYVHVFDGGNSDNLGLLSVKRVLLMNGAAALEHYDRIVVILVDSYRRSLGANPRSPNPRGPLSYLVDLNFLDATDSLLEANRQRLLREFFSRDIASGYASVIDCYHDSLPDDACVTSPAWQGPAAATVQELLTRKLFFFHVAFDAVTNPDVQTRLHDIPTTFKLEDDEAEAIERGVEDIFTNATGQAHRCVRRLGEIIARDGSASPAVDDNPWCGGASEAEKAHRQQLQQRR